MSPHPSAVPRLPSALALVLGLALSGCDAATNAYCDMFPATEMCCRRLPNHTWNPTTRTCDPAFIFLGS
jgi:hypothetical protein